MALNIAKPAENRVTTHGPSQNLKNMFNITINEPTQTHFSVEGVQSYTVEQVKAMKIRQEKATANREGEFITIVTYEVDSQMEFEAGLAPPTKVYLKAKGGVKQLQELQIVKEERPKTAKTKVLVRTEMRREVVKMSKEQQKLKKMEDRLSSLTSQYKNHFGDDLKVKKDGKKEKKVKIEQNVDIQEGNMDIDEGQEGEEFEQFDDEAGEQSLPQAQSKTAKQKPGKSLASLTKPDQDDSFQQVEWSEPSHSQVHSQSQSTSRIKPSSHSYSERLGSAVHLLFG